MFAPALTLLLDPAQGDVLRQAPENGRRHPAVLDGLASKILLEVRQPIFIDGKGWAATGDAAKEERWSAREVRGRPDESGAVALAQA